VREHLGARLEDLPDQLGDRTEIGRQDLDAGVGVEGVNLPDGLGIQARRAVGLVVAGDAGDGRVAQPHRRHRFGDAPRLVEVERWGRPVAISQKSQRRVQVSPPMRKVASRSSQHSKMLGQPASWHTVCRPSRLTIEWISEYCGPILAVVRIHDGLLLDGGLGVASLHAQQASAVRGDRHPVKPTPRG
jgi:hypothetical protein